MRSRIFRTISVSIFLLMLASTVAYGVTAGFDGVSIYSEGKNKCPYGDRAGMQYVGCLDTAINYKVDNKFFNVNESAKEKDISKGKVNTVNFYAYAGHGIKRKTYNAAHFFTRNDTASWHVKKNCEQSNVNATTNEARFGRGNLKWVTMYTCNWLNFSTSSKDKQAKKKKVMKQFEGARLVCGFASTMYLDSREGTWYGIAMRINNINIADAFVDGAKRYQPQKASGSTIYRVMGYKASASDKLLGKANIVPAKNYYKKKPELYKQIKYGTIKCNGKPI